MSSESINIAARSQKYDPPHEKQNDITPIDKTTTSIPPPTNGLHIEKHVLDAVLQPPKSTIQKSVFNPSVWAAQYQNILEDLDQELYFMYTLNVLQMWLTQRKNILLVLRDMDPENSIVIIFKLDDFQLSTNQLSFQLYTNFIGKKVHRIMLDEGSLNLVMSLSCW